MLKKLTLATALIASLGTAHAYQTEVGGTIALVDQTMGILLLVSQLMELTTSIQFAKNSPLNEAAFLNRASNINAAVSYIDYDLFDVTTFNVGVEYFVPNSDFM